MRARRGSKFQAAWLLHAAALLCALVWFGCGPRTDNSGVRIPPPEQHTTLGPGDVFRMQIVGEKDLPEEYQVASDGTVDLPYLQRMRVVGMEPQQIARLVRDELMKKDILIDPSVVVTVKEYNSKRVTVIGQVNKPGSFPLTPGLTLIQAVSLAGGFNSIANMDSVTLIRTTSNGAATVVLSAAAINEGRSPDVPLQAGDRIFVKERVF